MRIHLIRVTRATRFTAVTRVGIVPRLVAATVATLAIVALVSRSVATRQRSPDVNSQRGRAVYQAECQRCHGEAGRGDGPDARAAGFYPRDLSRGAFQCRCTPPDAPPTDADLMRTITTGLPGTPMPAFARLSESDRAAVLAHVKLLSKLLTDASRALCVSPPTPPARSAALVGDGRQLYRLLHCATCHGAAGRGDGPAAPALRDDAGHPAKPHDFVAISDFKCGNRDLDLFRTIQTGMSGTRMPSFVPALVFPSDGFGPTALETLGTRAAEASAYLGRQPTAVQLAAMTGPQTRDLLNRRTWALVYYLRSLFGPPR